MSWPHSHYHSWGSEGTEDSSSHIPGTFVMGSSDQYTLRFSLINQKSFVDLNSTLSCTEICFLWNVTPACVFVAVGQVSAVHEDHFSSGLHFAVKTSQFISLFSRTVYCKQDRISEEFFSELSMIAFLQVEFYTHAFGWAYTDASNRTAICGLQSGQFSVWVCVARLEQF